MNITKFILFYCLLNFHFEIKINVGHAENTRANNIQTERILGTKHTCARASQRRCWAIRSFHVAKHICLVCSQSTGLQYRHRFRRALICLLLSKHVRVYACVGECALCVTVCVCVRIRTYLCYSDRRTVHTDTVFLGCVRVSKDIFISRARYCRLKKRVYVHSLRGRVLC